MSDSILKPIYPIRHVARFVIEARTPLMVGCGAKSVATDAEVATDVNGLPFIPGTTLAGVLRHAAEVSTSQVNNLWGFGADANRDHDGNRVGNPDGGHGAEIIFSGARLVGRDGKPVDGLQPDLGADPFYRTLISDLPIRQHVRIGHRGTADDGGKFDNRVVLTGARFCFEVEVIDKEEDGVNSGAIDSIVALLLRSDVRFGAGTRNGYGQVELVSVSRKTFNLGNCSDRQDYIDLPSTLDVTIPDCGFSEVKPESDSGNFERVSLTVRPTDFFLFGAGETDAEGQCDMMPATELAISWQKSKDKRGFEIEVPVLRHSDERVIIPATSVKGALAHRTAFYFNKLNHVFADNMKTEDIIGCTGPNNQAVQQLFGYQDSDSKLHRGRVIFTDVMFHQAKTDKFLNHVSIDRFTGGAIAGALFTEKVAYAENDADTVSLDILIEKNSQISPSARQAFYMALRDLATGMLPLGGGVNRGHGRFEDPKAAADLKLKIEELNKKTE